MRSPALSATALAASLALAAPGCSGDDDPPVSSEADFDSGVLPYDADTGYAGDPFCWDLALQDGGGDRDDCDLAACESCVAACEGECARAADSSGVAPPSWSCPDGQSWTGFDVCEDWGWE